MWIGIVSGVLLFIVFCTIGFVQAKKNPKKEFAPDSAVFVERTDVELAIAKTIRLLVWNLAQTNKKLVQNRKKTDDTIAEYIEKYNSSTNINPELAQLLDAYKLDKQNENGLKNYYTAIAIYHDNPVDVLEIKKLCELDNERLNLIKEKDALEADIDEWRAVEHLEKRPVWKNSKCEEAFDYFFQLKNNSEQIEKNLFNEKHAEWAAYKKVIEDELNKAKKEKNKIIREKWGDFLSRTFTAGIVTVGRNGDKIAIWTDDGSVGVEMSIDDIMYFQISEKTNTNTTTNTHTYSSSTDKPSKLGTAVNEMIFGTAAATASAMQKNRQNTTTTVSTSTYTNTNREATIYFKYETGMSPLKVSVNSEVDKLIAMMPEKQK